MTAFVQLNLELWEAWRTGEISTEERDLGLYVGFETDFRTGTLTRTLSAMGSELRWGCSTDTVSRRLAKLREAGFVAYEVTRGQRRAYVIQPTARLLRAGRLAHDYRTTSAATGVTVAEVTAAPTSAEEASEAASQGRFTSAATSASEKAPIREEKRRSTQTAPKDVERSKRPAATMLATREARDLDEEFIAELEAEGSERAKMLANIARRSRAELTLALEAAA